MQQSLKGTATGDSPVAVSVSGFSVGKVEYLPFGAGVGKPAQPQWDQLKELRNKLAWVIGTFYGVDYSGKRTAAQAYVTRMTTAVIRDHGYPTN